MNKNNIPEEINIGKNPKKSTEFQGKLECPDCQEKSYSTPRGLTLHRRSFCRNRRTGFFCLICNEAFSNRSALSSHKSKFNHTEEKVKQNEDANAGKSRDKEDMFATQVQEHEPAEDVPDEVSPENKVMITVEFISEELKISRLRWKVPELAPIKKILERVRFLTMFNKTLTTGQ